MRSNEYRWSVENWANSLVISLGISKPPIDLFKVAKRRLIRNIKLRYMVPRGGLIPIQHGFEIYIRDTRFKEMEIADTEPTGLLSRR